MKPHLILSEVELSARLNQPGVFEHCATPLLEKIIDQAYEKGLSQAGLDYLETIYASRISEESPGLMTWDGQDMEEDELNFGDWIPV